MRLRDRDRVRQLGDARGRPRHHARLGRNDAHGALIGRRRTKEINILGALMSAGRAVELDLWNRVVPDGTLDAELDALLEVLRSKNQQAVRQLKFIINNGVEADLHTAQGFETLSATLMSALYGGTDIPDCDSGAAGIEAFAAKSELWQQRRGLARDFWSR